MLNKLTNANPSSNIMYLFLLFFNCGTNSAITFTAIRIIVKYLMKSRFHPSEHSQLSLSNLIRRQVSKRELQ